MSGVQNEPSIEASFRLRTKSTPLKRVCHNLFQFILNQAGTNARNGSCHAPGADNILVFAVVA